MTCYRVPYPHNAAFVGIGSIRAAVARECISYVDVHGDLLVVELALLAAPVSRRERPAASGLARCQGISTSDGHHTAALGWLGSCPTLPSSSIHAFCAFRRAVRVVGHTIQSCPRGHAVAWVGCTRIALVGLGD